MEQTYEFEELKICVSVNENGTDVRPYHVKGSCEYSVRLGWKGSDDEPPSEDCVEDVNNLIVDQVFDIETECELMICNVNTKWFLDKVKKSIMDEIENNFTVRKEMLAEFDKFKEEQVIDYLMSSMSGNN
jgi:hypothetical protein